MKIIEALQAKVQIPDTSGKQSRCADVFVV